jgi:mycofactocin precursor
LRGHPGRSLEIRHLVPLSSPQVAVRGTGCHKEVFMADRPEEELTADELLVEEVSIDGMCGVY